MSHTGSTALGIEIQALRAEIERLKAELRDAQARHTELIRANVEYSNRRENDIQNEIKQYCERWRESKDLLTRLADLLENKPAVSKGELELIAEARKAVLETRLRDIL